MANTAETLNAAGFALECTGGNNHAHTKTLPDGRCIYVGGAADGEPTFAPVETEDEPVCVEVVAADGGTTGQAFFADLAAALQYVGSLT